MGIRDFLDSFGSVAVTEKDGDITITGIEVSKFIADIYEIWRNNKVFPFMYKSSMTNRKYRLVFDSFFAPDVFYQMEQIVLLKKRKSKKYRLDEARKQLLTETWLKSTTEEHPDILDFSQLGRLKFKLLPTQMETLQEYNRKVPRMRLKGFLLGTPPGCLTGDTHIAFNRGRKGFTLDLETAYEHFNQLSSSNRNWDLSSPTYVRSYTGRSIQLNKIEDIVYSGIQEVFLVRLADGKFLKCTAQHPIMTNAGFVCACDIVGKLVMCDNKYSTRALSDDQKPRPRDIYLRVSGLHPFAVKKTRERDGVSYEIEVHRAIFEAYINSMSLDEYKSALVNEHRVQKMQFVDPSVYAIHHKDHNHYNNEPDNLIPLLHEEHKYYHAIVDENFRNFSQGVPYYVEAVSIESLGLQSTYDIVCEGPHHNFSANDMIVHNSGKTLMSIALSICLHSDVTIFVVPKNTVTTVWYDGIIEQFGPHTKIWSSVRDEPLAPDYDYFVFHYEALDKAIALARELRGSKQRPFIAIDEAHNLNELSSQRTLRLIELSRALNCQHTVFATGTPVKALGLEMIPLLRTIDQSFTPEVESRFVKIYGATAKRANDILRNRLGLISHRIIESDYMKIAPPIERVHLVTIPNSDRFLIKNIKIEMKKFMEDRYKFYQANMRQYVRIYEDGISFYERTLKTHADREEFKIYRTYIRKIVDNYDPIEDAKIAKFVKEIETKKVIPSLQQPLKNKFKDALSVYKYSKLRVMGEFLGKLSHIRAECSVEIAKYGNLDKLVLDADKKSIVFSSFIPALVACDKYFTDRGFKTLAVHGDQTRNIATIVDRFKKDPDVNPLFGTLQSLAASQTLTVANVVIFLDSPFREYQKSQAYHRVFRIGQDCQTYIYMCAMESGVEPNISSRSADILAWSQQQVESIFGSATREEAMGIVKQLRLNPPSGMDQLLGMIKNVFGM